MRKIKHWFYTEKFVDDGIMGSYKKVPTQLTEFLEALAGIILIAGFTYIMFIIAYIW